MILVHTVQKFCFINVLLRVLKGLEFVTEHFNMFCFSSVVFERTHIKTPCSCDHIGEWAKQSWRVCLLEIVLNNSHRS